MHLDDASGFQVSKRFQELSGSQEQPNPLQTTGATVFGVSDSRNSILADKKERPDGDFL